MAVGFFRLLTSVLVFSVTCTYVKLELCNGIQPSSGSEADIVSYLTDPCRYDKWKQPNPNKKTQIFVHIHVYSIGSVDEQNLRYTTQILLRYRWFDPRLKQDNVIRHEGSLIDKIWSPHLYIVNEQESKVMGLSGKDTMSSIQPDGTVVYLSRIKLTLQCEMDLKKFPFDSQRCPLILESWSYNISQLELVWEKDSPVTIGNQLQLPEYSLVNVTINSTVVQYDGKKSSSMNEHFNIYYGKAAGNFSTLTVHFALQRQYGFYIMDYYVPSIMIVAVSWVTFWLDANSTPGRTILGTSTMLTFITLSRNMGNSLPKVSYIKSTEIWFIGCTIFIFSSLAEFAFVNIIWRRKKNVDVKKVTSKHILQSTLTPQLYHKHMHLENSKSFQKISSNDIAHDGPGLQNKNISQPTSFQSINSNPFPTISQSDKLSIISVPLTTAQETLTEDVFTMTPQEVANWIDRRSRLFFPIAFLIFNCFYWTWSFILL